MTGTNENASDRLRTYGRRKGKALSERRLTLIETLLPRLRLDLTGPCPEPTTRLFEAAVDTLALEIGFGGGEHLLWQAEHNPSFGFIGCEPFINGVAKALSGIEAHGLSNVRLYDGDARDVIDWLPADSLTRVYILFPDPWPKKRHLKRRVISRATLSALARVMRPGAELRLATDIAGYARFMLATVAQEGSFTWLASKPADWRERPSDWPQTRYELKAIAAGRRCCYFRLLRR